MISHHRAFIARRRTERPSEEYRELTATEWDEFLAHFELRKVALGTCGRDYATPCQHENAPLTERTLEIAQFNGRMKASSTTVTGRDERCSPTRFGGPGGS
ncbi:hypothetical protein P2L57_38950, partial [Streptomyces ferralitis]|nr:hypothetical protein [Streptantibioticus ferralitis]